MSLETLTAECPLCEAELRLGTDVVQGEVVPCDDCGAELEIESLDPFRLTEAPDVAEDWGE